MTLAAVEQEQIGIIPFRMPQPAFDRLAHCGIIVLPLIPDVEGAVFFFDKSAVDHDGHDAGRMFIAAV